MRIGVAGIGHETNTFSTLRTNLADFFVRRGEECVQGEPWDSFRPEVEFAPCLIAGAMPNGLVSEHAYTTLKRELLERLEAQLPIDGLYLSLHGAMHVEGVGDGETDLLRAIRELVGPEMVIASSLDLHGNLSPEFVASVNILTALRTAPHIDGPETRKRGLVRLVRALREGKRPVTSMVKLPLILAGEDAVTAIEPCKNLYAHLLELEKEGGIWDASLMIGCAWTDSPYTSVSTLVVGEDRSKTEQLAQSYADMVWERRRAFGPEVETISADEAIQKAADFPTGPVFISESGDNVTAGGAGDVPFMLEKLLKSGLEGVLYAGLTDAAAVEACSGSVGQTVKLSLGGKLDTVNGTPLQVGARVLRVEKGTATVQIGSLTALITDGRRPFHTLAAFEPSGIDPLTQKIVVVKQGYLAPELRERCSTTFMALTPGFTDLRLKSLPYRSVVRPIYPLDDL
ncbi:MAG TPA: M81 family metallopeptidase [Fimbriimonas sp.]|nr:M81 family metallopeptidase [Fimbriimonas sp.]